MKSAAPKDSVPGILHELKLKAASFSRCYTEYGTYVDELESDKKRLQDAKDRGADTRQLEAVAKETADMLPITKKNTQKIFAKFVEHWNQNRDSLINGINQANLKDREKWQRDCGSNARNLQKTLNKKNSPMDTSETDTLQNIITNLQELAGGYTSQVCSGDER
eukprot:Protomagalhaensia_wolfi_Nauph_80__649@NODE_1369_length_1562_cov_839_785292_g1060_i0_p1_GENE_NODE_1369_length_1562_cov_839_785292_g1060_i0NODE_1369_length_1562_cov_839_785292_g1060_i0_p1_ORF_typecomplete_len164_score39_27TBCA/PF02970_16/4_7e07TBCA/PF02970_16/3_2e03PriC/PF07445_12/0_0052FliG_N/PF14842_6/0_18FliG_N/PF14842_6/7_4e03PTR/PF12789_7/0_17ACR_tran/PF00873_19/0_29Allexi_40kDa/PF05549_11/4_6e02Allexi_40kDa/PF05549_11/0_63_NODE_1369_length_1562_cov_839_785292_g1060_i08971388